MVGSADFPLRKTIAQNTGKCLKCILRQTYFFNFCWWLGGGVRGRDHLQLLSSLVRPSGNCSPTGIIENLLADRIFSTKGEGVRPLVENSIIFKTFPEWYLRGHYELFCPVGYFLVVVRPEKML